MNRIAIASGTVLEAGTLEGGEIREVDLRRATIKDAYLRNLRLTSVNMRDVEARGWAVEQVELKATTFTRSTFLDSSVHLACQLCEFEELTVERGRFAIAGGPWTVRASQFKGAHVELHGTGRLLDVAVEAKSTLILGADLRLEHGSHVLCENARLVGHHPDRWYVDSTRIELQGCILAGVWVDVSDVSFDTSAGLHAEGSHMLFSSCTGVVVLEADPQRRQQGLDNPVVRLRQECPQITFILAHELRNEIRRRDPKYRQRAEERAARAHGATARKESTKDSEDALRVFVARIRALGCESYFRNGPLWPSFERVDAERGT